MTPGVIAGVTAQPVRALAYLHARTAVNRLRAQAARLRSPRYIVAVVLGALYLWWALFRNARLGATPLTRGVTGDTVQLLVATFVLVSSARWWLFGGDRSTLAFTPAEVQFLFPAPLTRRTLVMAKLVRLQLTILINTLLFSVLLRGGAAQGATWQRGIGLWMLFSTLALHRLGAALVRASAMEHGAAGRRRSLGPMLIFGALVAAVAYGLLSDRLALEVAATGGVQSFLEGVVRSLRAPIPNAALWPVHKLLAPIFAAGTAAWWGSVPWAFALLLAHGAWVLRLDGAFEETALEATQHRAERVQRVRASQLGEARSKKGKLARVPTLAVRGRPEVAIAWKNIAAALRGGAWRTQLITFTLALGLLAVVSYLASARAGEVFFGVAIGWVAVMLFLGPLWMRFDLRHDLSRLALLKTFPIPGWRLVTAEIVAVTALHTVTVWALLVVPAVTLLREPDLWNGPVGVPLALTLMLAVPVFNALMFTVQNATALLFPAWVRLGAESRGFETMGQNLLTTAATTLVTAVALVFPVGLAALTWWLLDWSAWAMPAAAALGALVVVGELLPVWRWLGTVFDDLELTDVAAPA